MVKKERKEIIMKRVKSAISLLCALMLLLTGLVLAPASALANDSDYIISFYNGGPQVSIKTYVGSDTDVVIPEKINGLDVVAIGSSAFKGTSVKSVTLSSGIVEIGANAFEDCTSLTTVDFKNVHSIKGSAFKNCTGLKDITLPETLVSIGAYAFQNCNSLTKITIPDSVKNAGYYIFSGCEKLEFIKSGSGLNSLEYTFSKCPALKRIHLPLNTVTIGYFTFANNPSLEIIVIPSGRSLVSSGSVAFLNSPNVTVYSEKVSGSVGTSQYIYTYTNAQGIAFSDLAETDKTKLASVLASAKNILDNPENYSASSLAKLQLAYDNGLGVYNDNSVYNIQPDIDAAIFDIQTAVDSLKDAIKYGDVDDDGKIGLRDVLTVQKYLAYIITLDERALEAADVNLDGKVSMLDALTIQRYIVRLIPELPINTN